MTKKVVLIWTGGNDEDLSTAAGSIAGVSVIAPRRRPDVIEAIGKVDAFITSAVVWDSDFADAIARSPRLRWVQALNAGVDNILELGVPEHVVVSTAGPAGADAVAEHAIALLLALVRNLPAAVAARRRRCWEFTHALKTMRTLRGQRVALLGFGHVGRRLARISQVLGAEVLAIARRRRIENEIEIRDIEALPDALKGVDALVICAPLTSDTEGIVDATAFRAMNAASYLVNVSRGRIVDTSALVEALEQGLVAGAALDVTEPEPLPSEHRLWSFANVIITPHVAWAGGGEVRAKELRHLVTSNVQRFVQDRDVLYTVQSQGN